MKGVYLLLDRVVSQGSDLELTIFLPADVIDGPRVVVCASASVVRVENWIEEGSARVGVGAIIQRYELVQKKASPTSSPKASSRCIVAAQRPCWPG